MKNFLSVGFTNRIKGFLFSPDKQWQSLLSPDWPCSGKQACVRAFRLSVWRPQDNVTANNNTHRWATLTDRLTDCERCIRFCLPVLIMYIAQAVCTYACKPLQHLTDSTGVCECVSVREREREKEALLKMCAFHRVRLDSNYLFFSLLVTRAGSFQEYRALAWRNEEVVNWATLFSYVWIFLLKLIGLDGDTDWISGCHSSIWTSELEWVQSAVNSAPPQTSGKSGLEMHPRGLCHRQRLLFLTVCSLSSKLPVSQLTSTHSPPLPSSWLWAQ